jgi:hypothetical protein
MKPILVLLLASVPPMGWNSWDSYSMTVTEAQFKANAEVLAARLRPFGWEYAVVDGGWYLQNPARADKSEAFRFTMDDNGRYAPPTSRFPSAADGRGFRPLADYAHSLGLRFGIHMIRGIPRGAVARNLPIADSPWHAADAADVSDVCPWNEDNWGVKPGPAGQAYYDSLARLYASWGVDFLKVDCISDHPYKGGEIRMIHEALERAGRPIVLSLSPGPTALEHAREVREYSQMWRISNDFWDHWGVWPGHEWSQGLRAQFANAAEWAPLAEPGHWPDADMLPLGWLGPIPGEGGPDPRQTMLTHDEQRTLMTLWAVSRSPLIVGGNLTKLDDWTASLLTNPEVIAVDQHSISSYRAIGDASTAVWLAWPDSGEGEYLAVFNLGDEARTVRYDWRELGLSSAANSVRDLWERKDLGVATSFSARLAPHASVLYRVTAAAASSAAPK